MCHHFLEKKKRLLETYFKVQQAREMLCFAWNQVIIGRADKKSIKKICVLRNSLLLSKIRWKMFDKKYH